MGKRFEVLDSFRGLAAIFVVLLHMNYLGSITELKFFENAAVFVEFFFVLSGFVLVHSYGFRDNLKFKDFIISRIFRLLPLHIIMFSVVFIIELGKLLAYNHGVHFNNIPFENNNAIREIIPNLLLLQSWLPTFKHFSFNAPSWSISVEYYMYIILFITLLIKNKIRYFLWFIISNLAFILLLNYCNKANDILRGLSCFFAGSLTYLFYKKYHERFQYFKKYFTIIEFVLILSIIFLVISNIEHKSVILSLFFCITIFIFAFENGLISKILKFNLFKYFGKLSYSIYLVHYSILFSIIAFAIISKKFFGLNITMMIEHSRYIDLGNSIYNNIAVIITLGIIIFISGFTYKYIEQKGQDIGKDFSKRLANKVDQS